MPTTSSPGRAPRPSAPRPTSWRGAFNIPTLERHGLDRGDGGRVRLEVRRRRLGHRTAAELSKKAGGRPVRMFLDRIAGTPRRGQPSQRHGHGQARRDQGRQARRHDRRDPTGPAGSPAAPSSRCLTSTTCRPRREPIPTSSSMAATPAPCVPRAIPRAARSWKRPWTTWPTSSGSTRSSSGSRTCPPTTSRPRSTRPRSRWAPS